MTAALTASRVAVGHRTRTVLCDVDLQLERGEVVALIGRNGSGKTTLLRVLAGLAPPSAGEVRWFGQARLPQGPVRARTLGLVLQHEPAPWLTVGDVLRLGGADPARIATVLAEHRLQPLAARAVSELSGGERQRVALARAHAGEPGLYLLDEPTNHLDLVEQRAFDEWLSRIRQDAAVLLVTHQPALIARADRVLCTEAGRVTASGSHTD
jgi:ABC-type multidrug transport system ATPase subunit